MGKTALATRFCARVFDDNYKATIGVDFFTEKFEILGKPFKLQMYACMH